MFDFAFRKAVMTNEPFLPTVKTKELGAGHKEDAPSLQVSPGFFCRDVLLKSLQDCISIPIEVLQPSFTRSPIVQSVDMPLILDSQVGISRFCNQASLVLQ